MKKMNGSKAAVTLFLAVLVFFACLFVARVVETNGGNVDVDRLAIATNEGAVLSAKLWRPKTATAENPAPAVILVPGGNANLEYMSSVSLELARRGYVAIAIDPYTIGRSDVIQPTPDLGADSTLVYVKQLDFVDNNAIGMIGWSAGVGRMNAAAIKDGVPNGVKALFGFGAGAPGDPELAINQGYFIGKIETTYGFGVNKQKDINTAPAFTTGMQTDYVEFATWYGDLANNKGRILYTGLTGHILGLISKSGVAAACHFFNDALAPAPNGQINNFVFGWKELSTALAMVAIVVILITAGNLLLQTSFFQTLFKADEPAIAAKASPLTWAMLAVSILFGALVAKWAVFNGQQFLNKTGFLQIANVNGFVFWLLCLTAFSIVVLALRVLFDKDLDKAALKAHAKTSTSSLLKSLLLGFTLLVIGYFLVSLGDQFFNISPRFWKVQLNVLNPKRLSLLLIYLPLYIVPMLVFNFVQTSSYYFKDKPKLFTLLVWAANTLPALLFVFYVYGKIIFTGLTPITNAAMSRANGSMLDALLLMLPVSFISAHFYHKTKNFYIGAFINAMLFAWAAVGTDLITFLG
jgi:pimeloyl-ACP methyl ester carboxylesterase